MQSPGRKEAKGVQVEVRLDSAVSVPKVIILTDQMTEEVNAIVQMLSDSEPKLIAGFRDDMLKINITDLNVYYRACANACRNQEIDHCPTAPLCPISASWPFQQFFQFLISVWFFGILILFQLRQRIALCPTFLEGEAQKDKEASQSCIYRCNSISLPHQHAGIAVNDILSDLINVFN